MTYFINEDTIEKIKEASDIVDIISDYLPLKTSGANYVGLCPFHSEKTPSFTVTPSKQFFHCFGCGEGGDVVTFIMKRENLSYPEALKFLGNKQGIAIEEKTAKDEKLSQMRYKGYEMNKDAARFFHDNLVKDKEALNYLYNRNISQKVIKQCGLGYSLDKWESLYNHLKSKGYYDEDIEMLGLISKRTNSDGYYDKFRNRIIFPIIDTRGRVIGFGGRVMDDTMPKYLNSKETIVFSKGNHLYGLNLLNKLSDRKRIILVEGYMDVISLISNGINYGVASLGTALTKEQSKLLKRYGENVYICYDSDQAGVNATMKAIDILLIEGVRPKIILLDDFKDPDDFLREKGVKEFESKINLALNHIDYKIHINKQKYNLNEVEGRISFTIEIAKAIKGLANPIEKDVYIDKISRDTNISKEAIQKQVFGNTKKNTGKRNYKGKVTISPVRTIIPSGNLRAEIDLIKLMIFDKDYFEKIIQGISIDEFNDSNCREIFKIITGLYHENEDIDEELLLEKVKELPNMDNKLINLIFESRLNFSPENVDQAIKELINTLKINRIESKRNDIKKEIKELEKKQDKDSIEEERFLQLCMELINYNKELNLIRHEEGR